MNGSEFVKLFKLHSGYKDRPVKISVEGYGSTTEDYAIFFDKDFITISIAKPTIKDYSEKRWVKDED
jgi:hypothetical protein